MLRSTLATSQRWSHIFPIVDELFSSFRVFEFKVRSRRSLAALLSDGPSHVGKSNQFVLTLLPKFTNFIRLVFDTRGESANKRKTVSWTFLSDS